MFFSLSSMFAKNTKRNVYTAEAVREYIFRLRFHSGGRLKHRGKRRNKRIGKWKMHQACSFFLVRWWVAFVKTAEQGISCWRWLRGLIIISGDRQQLASGSCCGQAARLIAAARVIILSFVSTVQNGRVLMRARITKTMPLAIFAL